MGTMRRRDARREASVAELLPGTGDALRALFLVIRPSAFSRTGRSEPAAMEIKQPLGSDDGAIWRIRNGPGRAASRATPRTCPTVVTHLHGRDRHPQDRSHFCGRPRQVSDACGNTTPAGADAAEAPFLRRNEVGRFESAQPAAYLRRGG